MSHDTELKFAVSLAKEAGDIMRTYFRSEELGRVWKEDNTPVTVADLKINAMVIERVKAAYPEHGVLGEEESFEPERELVWVVDPIDGTIPFSLEMPLSTFLLALVDRNDGQPLIGIIYDPFLDHMFTATKGGGAFLNGKPIQVSKTMPVHEGYYSIHGPLMIDDQINYQPGRVYDDIRAHRAHSLTFASGGYTASKIACGLFAGVICGAPAKAWDFAAPALLVQEAGGVVSDLVGKPRRYDGSGYGCVLAANQTIHTELLRLIKGS